LSLVLIAGVLWPDNIARLIYFLSKTASASAISSKWKKGIHHISAAKSMEGQSLTLTSNFFSGVHTGEAQIMDLLFSI